MSKRSIRDCFGFIRIVYVKLPMTFYFWDHQFLKFGRSAIWSNYWNCWAYRFFFNYSNRSKILKCVKKWQNEGFFVRVWSPYGK